MKRLVFLAVVALALPAFAQQPKNDFQIFVYTSNVGITSTDSNGTTVDGGFGLAVSKFVAPHISAEASVTSQDWWEYEPGPYHFGDPIIRHRHTTYPISLDGQYHFFNSSRWKPYLGAGVRYVEPHAQLRNIGARISPEVVGGVSFMFTPSFSLRFDAKQEIRSSSGPAYDPLSRVSVGLGWHF